MKKELLLNAFSLLSEDRLLDYAEEEFLRLINCWDDSKSTSKDLEELRLLIAGGADVTAWNNYAIRLASANGHAKVVKLLMAAGADASVCNN